MSFNFSSAGGSGASNPFASASNTAQNTSGSVFGASSTPSSSPFGQPSTTSQAPKSLFGGTATTGASQAPSLFGATSASSSSTKTPLFSLNSSTGNAPGAGLFGGATTTSSSSSAGLFGTSNTPSSLFGQKKDEGGASASNENRLAPVSFGAPAANSASTSAPAGSTTPAPTKTFNFSTTPAGPPPADNGQASKPPGGGLFGAPKPGDSTQPKSNSLFSGTAAGTSLFGATPAAATPTNLFGGTSTAASSTGGTATPAAPAAEAAKPLFSFPGNTTASSTPSSQPAATTTAPAGGLFGAAGKTTQASASSAPTSSLFPSLSGSSSAAAATPSGTATSSAPSLFKLGTPSSAATSSTAAPTTTAAATSGLFGAAQPAASSSTQAAPTAATTAAPATTASSTANATQASTQPLGASTAGPTPQLSRLKNKTMDEIITRWASDLLKYQKEFQDQAAKAATWDRLLVENGEKIQKLYSSTYEAERASTEIERQLATVEGQQAELTSWLDRYEAEVDEVFTRQVGQGESLQGPDQERERTYKLAEKLTDRLDEMGKNITSMIEAVNDASSNLSKGSKADDPLSHIVRVLNSHLMQLQWIDQNAELLQAKVTAAQKAGQSIGPNGYGGGESDGVEAFYKSFGGRR